MERLVELFFLIVMDAILFLFMLALSISIKGSRSIGVEEINDKVKRGDKVPRMSLDTWIWRVTVAFRGSGVRRFVLFNAVITWLGLLIVIIILTSNLITSI